LRKYKRNEGGTVREAKQVRGKGKEETRRERKRKTKSLDGKNEIKIIQ
jgi:hypothetical protein